MAISTFGKYIIADSPSGEKFYFRTLPDCANKCGSSKSTLSKHSDANKENPFIIKKTGYKFYYSNEYIPVKINTAVLVEKSQELLQDNIDEGCDANIELTN